MTLICKFSGNELDSITGKLIQNKVLNEFSSNISLAHDLENCHFGKLISCFPKFHFPGHEPDRFTGKLIHFFRNCNFEVVS